MSKEIAWLLIGMLLGVCVFIGGGYAYKKATEIPIENNYSLEDIVKEGKK